MRLDKFLSDMGTGTRSEIKKSIRSGLVTVDGTTVRDPGFHVNSDSAVTFGGEPVGYEDFVYYMLHKPSGVISASDDSRETTVVDLITEQKRKDLFPVGRLDRDTEGLLIITNDGAMAHRLLSPRHHVDKVYFARVRSVDSEDTLLAESDVQAFRSGLTLPDGLQCLPAELEILSASEARVTIREGKFHQIKRMFLALGFEVIYLKRLSMGPVSLDPALAPGEYRRLTGAELAQLKSI